MSITSDFYVIFPLVLLVLIILLVYIVKIKPNLVIGFFLLGIGIFLIVSGFVLGKHALFFIGFIVSVFSLVFFPRRRRW
ncbi:hypothetical protein WIW89_00410 [Stygiolobus sp. CP850M]|uniref:hypothetical protein n=1 Tax=Stygiolobus sp. CP850M TaxID=3133134 RepID=UPI00307DDCD7